MEAPNLYNISISFWQGSNKVLVLDKCLIWLLLFSESETETVVELYDVRSSQIAHIPKEEPLMQSETMLVAQRLISYKYLRIPMSFYRSRAQNWLKNHGANVTFNRI